MKGETSVAGLPEITYRQLEVFSVTCKERSYANAALELHSTRANNKRVCQDFERAVGRACATLLGGECRASLSEEGELTVEVGK
jgi:uncharacterized metal-binding protein